MNLFEVSKAARSDLKNIAAYTQKNWGAKQRRVYLAKLDSAFHFLAANPLAGTPCSYILEGLRRHQVASHLIFYDLVNKRVFINRVLHSSVDFKRHLSG